MRRTNAASRFRRRSARMEIEFRRVFHRDDSICPTMPWRAASKLSREREGRRSSSSPRGRDKADEQKESVGENRVNNFGEMMDAPCSERIRPYLRSPWKIYRVLAISSEMVEKIYGWEVPQSLSQYIFYFVRYKFICRVESKEMMLKSVETVNNYVAQFFFPAYGMYREKCGASTSRLWRISHMFTTALPGRCVMNEKGKYGKPGRHVCVCVYVYARARARKCGSHRN